MTFQAASDVVELARALIRAASPNPPGDERAVASVVSVAAQALGLPTPCTIGLEPSRPNVLISLDFGIGGRHLVLSGHLDTKPVGDAGWSSDPLSGDIDGDRLLGLGSADMKAAVAAMLVAAGRLSADPPPAGKLSLLFTADEEDGARFGAHHIAGQGLLEGANAVVIGEPGGIEEDFDRLHLVSRGIARLHVVAEGRQGHSSLSDATGRDAAEGNAGVAAARAVVAIADGVPLVLPDNPQGLLGWQATVNTGLAFRGGVGYGVLPGRTSVDTEVRLLPGMDQQSLLTAFRETVAPLAVELDTPPNGWLPATMVESASPIARAARVACAEVLGAIPPDAVFPGTTDAAWFAGLGGIPTLPALGPGLLRRAHGADEWVSIRAVRQAVELYERLVRLFCAPDRITPGPGLDAHAGSAQRKEPSGGD